MDNLDENLKRDAMRIEVAVSDELDHRIEASLRAVAPQEPRLESRPAWFWWASTLTGLAAAAAVIAIVNRAPATAQDTLPGTEISPVTTATAVPVINWKTESAMLTSPLEEELEALQSDIKKAEQKVREELGIF